MIPCNVFIIYVLSNISIVQYHHCAAAVMLCSYLKLLCYQCAVAIMIIVTLLP